MENKRLELKLPAPVVGPLLEFLLPLARETGDAALAFEPNLDAIEEDFRGDWRADIASQSQDRRDVSRGVGVGTAVAYLTFSAVSFGVWQEWWLAVGGLAAAGCMAVQRQGRAENA